MAATVTEHGGHWTISFTIEVERAVVATRVPVRVIGVHVELCTFYSGATSHPGRRVSRNADPGRRVGDTSLEISVWGANSAPRRIAIVPKES